MSRFLNCYRCENCGEAWEEESEHMETDVCIACGAENEPFESQDMFNERIHSHC
jgi:predicted  nucleic acid-binding Zn-ribbon protein